MCIKLSKYQSDFSIFSNSIFSGFTPKCNFFSLRKEDVAMNSFINMEEKGTLK